MAQVTTFYSYKGGSGRSMTMANVAWALATNGHKVLVIDWDLEAPGLHRYFHPFLADPEQGRSAGLIDRIWDYIDALEENGSNRFAKAQCDDIVQTLDLPIRGKGGIDFLGAGRQTDHYSEKVGGLDWSSFYARFDGEAFITHMMDWARESYSHILIDSRTGVADTAGICTAQIPDALVMCFVYNRQSIEGTAAIARSVAATRKKRRQSAIAINYVPSRVEERGAVESARNYAAVQLAKTMNGDRIQIEHVLRRDEIRHYPWCAFEEKLAVFEDVPDERGSLLDAVHGLAERIAETDLKIMAFEPAVLTSYWQRAAFDDPRIVELRAIKDGPVDIYLTRLYQWLEETLPHPDERLEWLIELAEAAVELGGQTFDRISHDESEFLAASGLDLARRAYVEDAQLYRIRYALLLQARSAQCLKRGDVLEALRMATDSAKLFDELSDPVSRWRQARSIELKAEALEAQGDQQLSLEAYREAADLYQAIARRNLPLGTEIDQPRSLRQLAEKLYDAGDYHEADAVAARAVSQLRKLGSVIKPRNAGEVLAILGTRADTVSALGDDTSPDVLGKLHHLGELLLPGESERRRLVRRLGMAEVRGAMRTGRKQEAVRLLEQFDGQRPLGSAELQLRAELLLDIGEAARAADLLIDAISDAKSPAAPELVTLLEQALQHSGRENELVEILLTRMMDGEAGNMISWWPLMHRILEGSRKGEPLQIDAQSPVLERFLADGRARHFTPSHSRKKKG